jgi:hypothetical protein
LNFVPEKDLSERSAASNGGTPLCWFGSTGFSPPTGTCASTGAANMQIVIVVEATRYLRGIQKSGR